MAKVVRLVALVETDVPGTSKNRMRPKWACLRGGSTPKVVGAPMNRAAQPRRATVLPPAVAPGALSRPVVRHTNGTNALPRRYDTHAC